MSTEPEFLSDEMQEAEVPAADAPLIAEAAPSAVALAPAAPAAPRKKRQLPNLYTVMLGIALFCITLACIFLILELRTYNFEIQPGRRLF